MLDVLCKRKSIRDFLKLYSPTKWGDVISNICEIAILNLQSSFRTLQFSDEDFTSIIENIKHPPKRRHRTKHEHDDKYYYNYSDKPHKDKQSHHHHQQQHQHSQRPIPHHEDFVDYHQQQPYYSNNDYYERQQHRSTSSKGRYHYPKQHREKSAKYRNVQSKIKGDVERDKERYYNELRNKNEQEELNDMEQMRLSGSDNYENNNNEGNQFMFKEEENDKQMNVVNNTNHNEYNCTFGMVRPGEGEINQIPEIEKQIKNNE